MYGYGHDLMPAQIPTQDLIAQAFAQASNNNQTKSKAKTSNQLDRHP